MDQLILKRASASRPSGSWSEDDHDVLSEGEVVGRIMKVTAAPEDAPWMWTLAYGQRKDRWPTATSRRARPPSPRAGRRAIRR
jgi:hypothetical protein